MNFRLEHEEWMQLSVAQYDEQRVLVKYVYGADKMPSFHRAQAPNKWNQIEF